MAGGFVLANDASGVGAADDWVLPFLLVGLIATHLTTEAPAPPADVAQAWGEVIAGLEAVGKTGEGIRAAGQRVSPMPPMDECQAHFQECMASRLSLLEAGGMDIAAAWTAWIAANPMDSGRTKPLMVRTANGGCTRRGAGQGR